MIQISQVSSPVLGAETPESPAERSLFSLSVPRGLSGTTLSPREEGSVR
jgi:hypothetical protein